MNARTHAFTHVRTHESTHARTHAREHRSGSKGKTTKPFRWRQEEHNRRQPEESDTADALEASKKASADKAARKKLEEEAWQKAQEALSMVSAPPSEIESRHNPPLSNISVTQ